jgi:hypothetical protein
MIDNLDIADEMQENTETASHLMQRKGKERYSTCEEGSSEQKM